MSDWIRTVIADTKAGTGLERENREKLERRLLRQPPADQGDDVVFDADMVNLAVDRLIERGL